MSRIKVDQGSLFNKVRNSLAKDVDKVSLVGLFGVDSSFIPASPWVVDPRIAATIVVLVHPSSSITTKNAAQAVENVAYIANE